MSMSSEFEMSMFSDVTGYPLADCGPFSVAAMTPPTENACPVRKLCADCKTVTLPSDGASPSHFVEKRVAKMAA